MPIHACMQQIHLIAARFLTLLIFNKQKLEYRRPPILPTKEHTKTNKYKQPNSENEYNNMIPKSTHLARIME
jgi:hypothetical protein